MPCRAAAVGLLVALLPATTRGAPATIRIFEATARTAPSRDAAPVQTFPEGTAVSVSEEVKDGWRRIRIADGSVAWIEDAALQLDLAAVAQLPPPAVPAQPTAVQPPPPGTSPPRPDLHAQIYVKDLDHLAQLVQEDARARAVADRLVQRKKTSWAVAGVGIGLSTVFTGIAVSKMGCHSDLNDPKFGQSCGAEGYLVAGVATALGSALLAWTISPTGGDLLDVINEWNTRHPDRPFTLAQSTLAR